MIDYNKTYIFVHCNILHKYIIVMKSICSIDNFLYIKSYKLLNSALHYFSRLYYESYYRKLKVVLNLSFSSNLHIRLSISYSNTSDICLYYVSKLYNVIINILPHIVCLVSVQFF